MSVITYETVIGLETHVQLATKSKLFCGCDNDARVAEPNTQVCPVCMGLPGALPVTNAQAVRLAIRAGLVLNGEMGGLTKFDRKNYFYPDLPSGYQITQFDQPIIGRGEVGVPIGGKMIKVGITRAHLEADAGKLTHPDGADYSLVDLNRSGTPLLEIVSEPDLRSPAEAKAYAQEIYNLMRYAEASDANLYYGNMRFDVNISLRLAGTQKLGTRAEIKNLNSFKAVERAAEFEITRQTAVLARGDKVIQETRGWDDTHNKTFSQRSKEEANDYRYFPEPDLPPLIITQQMIDSAKSGMGLMPAQIREMLGVAGVNREISNALVSQQELIRRHLGLFEQPKQHAGRIANWLGGEIMALVGEDFDWPNYALTTQHLIKLSHLVADGQLSNTAAKQVLEVLATRGGDPLDIAKEKNLIQVSNQGELEQIVEAVIAENQQTVADYRAGKIQVLGFLVGAVMKASRGQANPAMVNDILKTKLASASS